LADLTDGPAYEASHESTTDGVTEYALPLVDGPIQPVAQLVWKEGSMEAIIPFATSEITIGTRPNDDIVLARRADEAARTLYRIFRKGEEFWAHDQRGGAPEAPRRLRAGELFTIGNQLFRLDVEDPDRTDDDVVPEATVEIRSGLRRGTKARVTKKLVVGSDEASDLCVPTDGALAPRHFEVAWRDGAFYLTHTAPIGSTAVNGTPVTERRLVGGDILLAGHTVFTFHLT
jgi:predicted component of type VI protein secretion system